MRYIFDEDTKSATQSVSEFLTAVNSSLVRHRGRIEGEVTSVKDTYATAVYFTIKDTVHDATLNCVIWRTTYQQNGVSIKEGDQVIVTGVPEIYAARGSFSLKVQTIEYAGEGALKKAYDTLKTQLAAEGLLATTNKRTLPLYPKKIGVITSRSGVVIQDFSANLGRYGFVVHMVDSRVEGKDAIHELLAALKILATEELDVLVIMRGGGSWESLQAFNTESVVRAIADFPYPVVTGIGHDVDVTLAELVADVGASTPTAVAEVLNESWETLRHEYVVAETDIRNKYRQLVTKLHRTLDQRQVSIYRRFMTSMVLTSTEQVRLTAVVQGMYRQLAHRIQVMDTAVEKMVLVARAQAVTIHTRITQYEQVVGRRFGDRITQTTVNLDQRSASIVTAERRVLREVGRQLTQIEQQIKTYDPARPLALGYSLSYVEGKLLRQTATIT
ncbi:MAG: hypothetical protein RLZZ70_153, partial [Candidatus Parcubacteria bacterium]